MKPVISAIVLTLGVSAFATSASAEDVCMPATELKASLTDWYGETPVDGQKAGNLQIWASQQTGTWTAVRTLSDGLACVEDQGKNWLAGPAGQRMIMASLD